MTYIVVSENEVVKAEMERPSFSAWEIINPCVNKDRLIKPFQEHCLSLPRIAIQGKHNWKVWQEVPESEVRLQHQMTTLRKQIWYNCSIEAYNNTVDDYRRIVAIPIQPTPEGEKVEERIKLQPIRVRNLSMPYDVFVSIKNYTLHNNTVVADTLFQAEDDIEADFFHSKETNIRVKINYAGDLVIRLLRMGIMVHFLDDSAKHVQKISPPLYNKYYATHQR